MRSSQAALDRGHVLAMAVGDYRAGKGLQPELLGFTVKQHWHTRYHNDPGNRWLRSVCAELFLRHKGET